MQRGNKTISNSLRPKIETIKSHIRNSNGMGFDGDGYAFKKAVAELRKEGLKIKYCRQQFNYRLITP